MFDCPEIIGFPDYKGLSDESDDIKEVLVKDFKEVRIGGKSGDDSVKKREKNSSIQSNFSDLGRK